MHGYNINVRLTALKKYVILTFFSAEDEAAATRFTARNGLKSYYVYATFVNSLTNEKPADKFDAADKSKLDRQTKPSNSSMPLRKVWKGEYRKNRRNLEATAK